MKLTITWRFVALSTLVVAVIFAMFNAFVYLEFENVNIQNEKQVLLSRLYDMERKIQGDSLSAAVATVNRAVPDPKQMVRLLGANQQVLTATSVNFLPKWLPQGQGQKVQLGNSVFLYQQHEQRVLLASASVRLQHSVVTLQWLENVELLDRSIAFVFYLLLTGSLGGLAIAAVASYFLARYSLQPIRELIATARSITPGDLSSRIEVPKRRDELSELGQTFNEMLDRLSSAFLRERQFVADASHELRTPLSVLEGYVNLLRRWGWEDEALRREAVAAIEEEIHHLRLMTGQMLSLAAMEQEEVSDRSLHAQVGSVVESVTGKWVQLYPQFEWNIDLGDAKEAMACIESLQLEQVLRALLDNSRKYTPSGEKIAVMTSLVNGRIHLIVKDSGEGIPAEDLPYVTERFYRADKARSRSEGGAGLGLAICREIIEKARGQLIVRCPDDGGTEVEVVLLLCKSGERDEA